jgi:hypothetical protein
VRAGAPGIFRQEKGMIAAQFPGGSLKSVGGDSFRRPERSPLVFSHPHRVAPVVAVNRRVASTQQFSIPAR